MHKRMIALDVELDGMRPSRIIQLSYLIIDGRRVRGKNMYFSVNAINRYAKRVHGLGIGQLRRLSRGDIFAFRAPEIMRDFKNCTLVIGHDVSGDMRYLRYELKRVGLELPHIEQFCTLKRYTEEANIPLKQNPAKLKPPKLEELMRHFGVTPELVAKKCKKWFGGGDHAHDARFDAAAAYLCMLVGEEQC